MYFDVFSMVEFQAEQIGCQASENLTMYVGWGLDCASSHTTQAGEQRRDENWRRMQNLRNGWFHTQKCEALKIKHGCFMDYPFSNIDIDYGAPNR